MSDTVAAQDHLPECPTGNPYTDLTLCICDRLFACEARVFQQGVEQGQRDERERHANELDVAVAKARAEVVTVDLEGDFNYVKGYNDGLVEGDAKGRREGEQIGQERVLIAWKEAEPLHDAEVRADEREKAIERVEAWLDRDEWGEAEFVRSAVIDALRGESNG